MQDPTQSKFVRAKQFIKDNEGPIAFGVGITVGAVLVAKYPKFFLKPDAFYNPTQPIPGFGLNESAILRNTAAGWMAVDFLLEKELIDEFIEFAGEVTKASLNVGAKK